MSAGAALQAPREIQDIYMDLAFSRTGSSGAVVLSLSPAAAHELETLIAEKYPEFAAHIDMHRRLAHEAAA